MVENTEHVNDETDYWIKLIKNETIDTKINWNFIIPNKT